MARSWSRLALWDAYKINLDILNDRLNHPPDGGSPGQALDPAIDRLLSENNAAQRWEDLYESEQRLAALMSDDLVQAEATRRFAEAERLGVFSAPDLKTRFDNAPDAAGRRAAFICLLDDLHFRYAKRRLDRQARAEAAGRFSRLLNILIVAAVPLLAGPLYLGEDLIGLWQYGYVIWFGLLGAYFSRLIDFQSRLTTLDYDSLQLDFAAYRLGLRLFSGAIGALILYFLVMGGLIQGSLFPGNEGISLIDSQSKALKVVPVRADLAKLIVWSFIAGFSERLIPTTLTALESKFTADKK